MRCVHCGHDPEPKGPQSVAAHLYVTDIDRAALVIPGDTMAKRAANAVTILAEARTTRLFNVLSAFCATCNSDAPPFADESVLWHVQGVIRAMVAKGDLSAKHEQRMLESVHFTPDGRTSGNIVSMFGEVIE